MILAASGMLLLLLLLLGVPFLDRAGRPETADRGTLVVDSQIAVDPDRPDRWYVAIGGPGSGRRGSPGAVHAYDGGRLLWRSEVPQTSLLHPVVVAAGAGLVYVQGAERLVVLDADSGRSRAEISHPSVPEAPGSYRYDEEREMIVMFGHAGGPVQQLPLGAFAAGAADRQTRERWAEAGDGGVYESSRRQLARPLEAPAFRGTAGEYTMLGEPPSLALDGTRLGAAELPSGASFVMVRRLLPCGAPGATTAPGAPDPSATSSDFGVCSAGLVAPGAETGYVPIRAGRWFHLVSLADGSVPVHGAMNGEPRSVFALPDGTVVLLGGDHRIMTLSPDGFLGRNDLAANELERP
ncbi:MAG: hypothetical protein Q4E05_11990 [Pseudoclavibacter sp.]|nr:hypothetical protein [Pseudoclavibacter sp.]